MLVQLPNGDWVNPAFVAEVRVVGPIFIDGADPARWSVRIHTLDQMRYHSFMVKGTEQDAIDVRDYWAATFNAAMKGEPA